MLDFLWNFRQQQQIRELDVGAVRGEHSAQRLQREVRALEERLETMHLVTMAMWSIMQRKLGVSDAELAEVIRELDLRDGKLDGKMSPRLSKCAACGRVMSERHARCLYCGDSKLDLSSLDSD